MQGVNQEGEKATNFKGNQRQETHPCTASFKSGTQMLSSPQSSRIWAYKTNNNKQRATRDSQKEFSESFNRDNQRLSDMLLTCEEDRAEAEKSSVCLKGVDAVTSARCDMWRD